MSNTKCICVCDKSKIVCDFCDAFPVFNCNKEESNVKIKFVTENAPEDAKPLNVNDLYPIEKVAFIQSLESNSRYCKRQYRVTGRAGVDDYGIFLGSDVHEWVPEIVKEATGENSSVEFNYVLVFRKK